MWYTANHIIGVVLRKSVEFYSYGFTYFHYRIGFFSERISSLVIGWS